MALFQELLNNTMSPDVRYLAAASAIDRVSAYMDAKEAREIVLELMHARQGSPFDGMF